MDDARRPPHGAPPTRSAARRRLTRRRAIRRAAAVVLVLAAWMAIGGTGGPLVGRLSEVQQNDSAGFLPRSTEATRAAAQAARFVDTSALPLLVVVTRPGGVTDADRQAVRLFATALPGLVLPVGPTGAGEHSYRVGDFQQPGAQAAGVPPVVPSQDGAALLLPVSLDGARAASSLPDGASALLRVTEAIRAAAQHDLVGIGLQTYVTGPGGMLADLVTAFAGIDGKLLAVSLTAVFLILLLVYRSPLLPLAALLTSGFALAAAASVIYPLAKNGTLTLDGQSQGILSILVIGASTDYALLLVARYREELHDHPDTFRAMRLAWRGSVEPIVASGATVIAGLLCLMLSRLGSTRGLGPVAALGILGALAAALTILPILLVVPAVLLALMVGGVAFALGALLVSPLVGLVLAGGLLAVGGWLAWRRWRLRRAGLVEGAGLPWYARAAAGRWLFWPRSPHVDHVRRENIVTSGRGGWSRLARLIDRRPRTVWISTLAVLLVAAAFVPTLRAGGTAMADVFRDPVESVTGASMLEQHFPAGAGTPARFVVPETESDRALALARAVPGVATASVLVDPTLATAGTPAPRRIVDGQVMVEVTLSQPAETPAAQHTVQRLRTVLDEIGQDVLVGGATAVDLDTLTTSRRDFAVVAPAILLVIALVLILLLRSVLAPLILVGVNVVSFGATLGISALVFNHVFDFPGADPSIPLYAFVFLVALGIDYSIFLMTRVREESRARGTRPGVLAALVVTGGVITSAGVVLAATFGALASVPLLFLREIAFIVAFGVLLDTLVVRSLLVPALTRHLGDRVWWPARIGRQE